jgi:O-antigen/teichoic acid export membrane protein
MAGKIQEELEEFGIEVAKSTSIYVGAQLASTLISFFVLILPARVLSTADFGIFVLAIAFATLLGFGGNLSFGSAMRRMLPASMHDKARQRSLLGNAYFVGSMSGLTITIIALLFSNTIAVAVYHNAQLSLPLRIASIMIILTVLFNLGLSSLVGLGKTKEAAISDLLYSSAQLAAVALLLYAGYGVSGAVAGMTAGFLAGIIAELFYLRSALGNITVRLSKLVMKQILGFSLPVFASDISTMGLTNFAVLFLAVFASTSIVGNYGVAFKLGAAFQVVTVSSTFIMLSSFSKALNKARLSKRIGRIYANSVYYSFLFVLPLLAYLVASATPFIYMLFSSRYVLAPSYFVVIAMGITLGMLASYAGNLMLAYGHTRRFMRYQLIAIAVGLVLMLALTPYFGVTGILASLFVVSPILLAAMYCVALEKDFKLTLHYRKLSAITAAAALTAILAVLLPTAFRYGGHTALLINLLIVLLVYPLLVALFGGITERNIQFLRKFSYRLGPAAPLLRLVLSYAALFAR